MVNPASIGISLSFFYQLSLSQVGQTTALLPLMPLQTYVLQCEEQQMLLHSAMPMPITPAAAFALPDNTIVASVRLFGSGLSLSVLAQLLQALWPNTAINCQLYQPHPALAVAVKLHLTQSLSAAQQLQLAQLATELQVEQVYLTAAPSLRHPGVLVMDMDSTAIQIECIDEIAKLAGTGEQVAAVTARAMNGELDFAQSLVARVATLAGAPETILRQVLDAVPLMPGLTELVAHLQQQHWQVAIASGGFTYFTDALKQRLGLTATFANVLEINEGKLTGKVLGDIVDATTKAQVVATLAAQYGIANSQTVAIGDGANDIPMLNAASLGVAFHAKPKVQAQAKAAIRQGSLLQLLYLLD
ncbi:phosphoserine phosphatase SerB [Rheinheimera fenheensis]|uniref:phosphoserine phosphatase SerB n=1 Tax=Rheinheimera fenheensis TaxID=3152295 RepID=UPI00325F8BD4